MKNIVYFMVGFVLLGILNVSAQSNNKDGSLNLGTKVFTTPKTESMGGIISANNIPATAQVTLSSAIMIILKPGFIANSGCVFSAYIDDNGNALKSEGVNQVPESSVTENAREEFKPGEISLKVYPNPSNGKFIFNYQVSNEENVNIAIYSSEWKLLKQIIRNKQDEGEYNVEFDATDLSDGIYFAKFQTIHNFKTVKLIVAK